VTDRPILSIQKLSLGFGERTLLDDLTFDVPARGILTLLGAAGVGKSTLLRTLARRAELLPAFWSTGDVRFRDRDLLRDYDPAIARREVVLIAQKARLHTASVLDNVLAALPQLQLSVAAKRARARDILDRAGLLPELGDHLEVAAVSLPLGLQRRLTFARIAAAEPAVVLVDEPTRDVPTEEATRIEAMLIAEAHLRAVVYVTHDLGSARRIATDIVLLAASRQIAYGPAPAFFANPPDPISERFIRQGNAWPSEAEKSHLAPRPERPQASSFQWLLPGLLGGMARPGLVFDEPDDLAALRQLGIRRLVSLEPTAFSPARLAEHGIASVHLPIADMEAPGIEAAHAVITETEDRIRRGEPTIYHCKGGLGRTGTLLAAHLIVRGMAPLHTLEELRSIHPRYVQSIAQERFLDQLAAWLRAR
jgi:ABC-type phosphate transport system ATPase subunit